MNGGLNRVITPFDVFVVEEEKGREVKLRQIGLSECALTLIREGAREILVPAHSSGWQSGYISYLDGTQTPLSSRVKLLDKDGVCATQVKKFLSPVVDEALSYKNGEELAQAVDSAGYFLYMTILGSKERAEIGVSLSKVRRSLLSLSKTLVGEEARLRIDSLSGIANQYQRSQINSLRLESFELGVGISEWLDEVLLDARIQDISRKRHELGNVALDRSLALTWLRTRRWFHRITSDSKYKKLIKIRDLGVDLASQTFKVPVSSILSRDSAADDYRPTCVDVDGFLLKEMKQQFGKECALMKGFAPWAKALAPDHPVKKSRA